MKIPYYPGCTLKTQARNLETSALNVAEKLGIQLIELPRWNCCGTVFSLTELILRKPRGIFFGAFSVIFVLFYSPVQG